MSTCQNCGNNFPQEQMADWTICFGCMRIAQESMGYKYTDSLGIGWTEQDLEEAGGISEVERLCSESRIS